MEAWVTLPARLENLEKAQDFVDGFLQRHRCQRKVMGQIQLAVEEIFVNIAQYAYQPDSGEVTIGIGREASRAVIVFEDKGIPYNPLERPEPDLQIPAAKREAGGLGIYMVKKNMDEVFYEYRDKKNILTLKKEI